MHRTSLLVEIESNVDLFFRVKWPKLFFSAIGNVADFVGADPKNLVLTQNATTALNAVLKSLRLRPEDQVPSNNCVLWFIWFHALNVLFSQILINNHTYNAITNTSHATVKKYDADTLSLDFKVPIESESDIVDLYVEVVERNRSIRAAVIDHISSQSGIMFPVAKIASALHAMGVIVIVDGAHAPGQVQLGNMTQCDMYWSRFTSVHAVMSDLEELGRQGVDYYAGNLHKWLYAPRGCALLWVNPAHHGTIEPAVMSNSYGGEDFRAMFLNQVSQSLQSEEQIDNSPLKRASSDL
jgi:isopenicillin-N epimerase